MGYLAPILIAFSSLAYGEFGFPVSGLPIWALALCLPLPYLLGMLEERGVQEGRWKVTNWTRRLLRAFPVGLQFSAVALFGWLDLVEAWFGERPGFEGWPSPVLVAALAPFLLGSAVTIDAQSRRAGIAQRSLRGFQARMFLTALGPVLAYILVAWVVGSVDFLRLGIGQVSLWSFGFSGAIVLSFAMGLPHFLRLTWKTTPIGPGGKRVLLTRVAELARFRCRQILVWNTGHLVANAAIVGLTPGSRRVFFTDELLDRMGPRQLAAVFAHEIGHAKRHHVAIFLVWSIAVFAALDWGIAQVDPLQPALGYLVLGACLLLWLIGFGWLSRRIELEADLFSLELLQDSAGITSALHAVSGGYPHRGSWRHFSTAKRVAFLESVVDNPLVGIKLHRTIRKVAILGLVLAVLGGGWRVSKFIGDYPVERATLDLGLGRYASAAERLAALEGDNVEELTQLARLGQAEGLESPQTLAASHKALAELAERDLRDGEFERASAWLTLAALGGDEPAAASAQWLSDWLKERGAPPELPDSTGPWRALLERSTRDH